MKFVVSDIRVSPDDDIGLLRSIAAKKIKISPGEIKNFKIIKESIDARRKPDISLVYSISMEVEGNIKVPSDRFIKVISTIKEEVPNPGNKQLRSRPVIVGSGPAGLFAGLVLAQNGYKPLIIERGECFEKRLGIVKKYWEKGELDCDTNVQFGEGGAGTFSDGKLTTRINDYRCERVLEEFHKLGANEEILYKYKPHIGSDILGKVIVNMRRKIEGYGGEIRFNSKLTSLRTKGGKITGAVVNSSQEIEAEIVVLAVGHSARDTYWSLLEGGVTFIQKPFSIGVRIEHPQDLINKAQFGKASIHPKLGAADYQLFYKTGCRTVYTFCMCPGGMVVASASEAGMIVTNGMSEFARDRENANSALVVSVSPDDFGSSYPLAGVEFQRIWEKLAFKAGGGDGAAPVQRLEDFLYNRASCKLGSVRSGYTGNVRANDINLCLPDFVRAPMKESIGYFDSRLKGFGMKDAVLTGVETRTSSPVRIPRDDSFEAVGIKGLYPAGEGAGYAGGIVSAAVDGIRVAEQIIKVYSQPI